MATDGKLYKANTIGIYNIFLEIYFRVLCRLPILMEISSLRSFSFCLPICFFFVSVWLVFFTVFLFLYFAGGFLLVFLFVCLSFYLNLSFYLLLYGQFVLFIWLILKSVMIYLLKKF